MKNEKDIFVMALSEYTRPDIVETKTRDYVLYGKDNDHFQYLCDRYIGSTTNQAVIDGKANLIFGKGLAASNVMTADQIADYTKAMGMLKDRDIRKIVHDFTLWEMAAIRITRKGRQFKFEHWPMETLRAEKMDDDGEIKAWYYHPTWERKNYKTADLDRIPVFDPEKNQADSIHVICKYVPGRYYYPPVSYEAAVA